MSDVPPMSKRGTERLSVGPLASLAFIRELQRDYEGIKRAASDRCKEHKPEKREISVTYNKDQISKTVGGDAATGVSMLGAEKVKLTADKGTVSVIMTRPEDAKVLHVQKVLGSLLISDDLVFDKREFSFAMTKTDGVLHLSNIKGLSIGFKGKDGKENTYPITSLKMFTKNGSTMMEVKYEDANNKEKIKTVRARLENTFNGFDQFYGAGLKLSQRK